MASAPTSFLSATDSGVILNRFSQDLQLIDMELPVAFLNTVASMYSCTSDEQRLNRLSIGLLYRPDHPHWGCDAVYGHLVPIFARRFISHSKILSADFPPASFHGP